MVPLYVDYTNEMCTLFLQCHIQKLGRVLVIFAVQHIHFVWGEFVFAPTVPCIIHLLKVHCHSVSIGKLYKMWIVLLSHYSKLKANVYILDISKVLLGFQVKIKISHEIPNNL